MTRSLDSPTPAAPLDQLGRGLRDLRISVIDRCNFRCPYCMPADLFTEDYQFAHRSQWLTFDEIERIARAAARLGVHKLRLTGGEPLLRPNLTELVRRLRTIAGIDDLALTTNGVLLPRQARDLKVAGLDRITISLDTLDPEVFHRLSGGRGRVDEVLKGIAAAEDAGFTQLKLNVVVQKGVNEDDVFDVLARFRGTGHIVRLIEFMDVGNRNGWNLASVVPNATLRERIAARWPLEPLEPAQAGETARRYRYRDGQGELGFISSVSQPFCGGCTRARLTCEGTLFTCLFAGAGLDLREPLRAGCSDDALAQLLVDCWRSRNDRYSAERSEIKVRTEKVEMYRMGG